MLVIAWQKPDCLIGAVTRTGSRAIAYSLHAKCIWKWYMTNICDHLHDSAQPACDDLVAGLRKLKPESCVEGGKMYVSELWAQ